MLFPSSADLPDPEIKSVSLISPALEVSSLPLAPPGKPIYINVCVCVCVCVYTFIECNLIDTKHQLISGYTYLHIALITLNARFGLICNFKYVSTFSTCFKIDQRVHSGLLELYADMYIH